jgi:hypothetical protein
VIEFPQRLWGLPAVRGEDGGAIPDEALDGDPEGNRVEPAVDEPEPPGRGRVVVLDGGASAAVERDDLPLGGELADQAWLRDDGDVRWIVILAHTQLQVGNEVGAADVADGHPGCAFEGSKRLCEAVCFDSHPGAEDLDHSLVGCPRARVRTACREAAKEEREQGGWTTHRTLTSKPWSCS